MRPPIDTSKIEAAREKPIKPEVVPPPTSLERAGRLIHLRKEREYWGGILSDENAVSGCYDQARKHYDVVVAEIDNVLGLDCDRVELKT